jgi:hypothetical protein
MDMHIDYEGGGRLLRLGGSSANQWRPTPPTWERLLALEPGLAAAEAAVVLARRPLRYAEWRFIEDIVDRHVGLFGANALHPVLGEMAAREAALRHLRRLSEAMRRPPRLWRRPRW